MLPPNQTRSSRCRPKRQQRTLCARSRYGRARLLRGPVAVENLLDDRAGTTASNDMEDDIVVLKHPVPPIDAIDPHAGFVGINHPRLAQSRQNGVDLSVKTRFCPLE